MAEIQKRLNEDKKIIITSFLFTFLWGLLTHGYVFISNAFSHDSLKEYIGNPEILGHKVGLGRIFVPYYQRFFRGIITLPWVIGAISLVCLSISIYLLVKLLKTENYLFVCIMSGIFVTNISVTALAATYMHDMDCYMVAILMSTIAVFCWSEYKYGFLIGVPFITVMLGLYQSYLSIPIMLIILVSIRSITFGDSFKNVLIKGLKAVAMLLIAGGLYMVAIRIVVAATGVPLLTSGYNTLGVMFKMTAPQILKSVAGSYIYTVKEIFVPASAYSKGITMLLHYVVVAIIAIVIMVRLIDKNIKPAEKILLLALLLVSPVGMNIARILADNYSHELMHYAIRLIYFYAFVLAFDLRNDIADKKIKFAAYLKNALVVVIFIIMWGNVRLANTAYMIKDYQYDANLALFSRILSRVEVLEGYIPGETEVAFIGDPEVLFDPVREYENVRELAGMDSVHMMAVLSRTRYQALYRYMLMMKIKVINGKEEGKVLDMPRYPAEGSVRMIDDIVYVRF